MMFMEKDCEMRALRHGNRGKRYGKDHRTESHGILKYHKKTKPI